MKKFLCVLLALLILCTTMSAMLVSAIPQKNYSMNVLVLGNKEIIPTLRLVREIGTTQKVEISFYMPYGGDDSLDDLERSILDNKVFCSDYQNGGFYILDRSYQEGQHFTSFTASTNFQKLFRKYEFDCVVFTQNLKNSSKSSSASSVATIQENIKKYTNKNLKTFWHEYWSLEKSSSVSNTTDVFAIYNNDWKTMQQAIKENAHSVAREVDTVISVGTAFNTARINNGYNPDSSNKSLLEDESGTLSTAGNYLAALTWYMTITGCELDTEAVFKPDVYVSGITDEQSNALIETAINTVKQSGVELKSKEEVFPNEDISDKTTSSELVYNPDGNTNDTQVFDAKLPFIIGGAVLFIAAAVMAVIIIKKKKTK